MTDKLTYKHLAQIYGFDAAKVSREWKAKGHDISQEPEEIFLCVNENVLKPLGDNTYLKEQQAKENLRLTKVKADQAELEAAVLAGSLISVEYCSGVVVC